MIWLRLMHGKCPPLPFRGYMEADRRDADLMLGYEQAKADLIRQWGLPFYLSTRQLTMAVSAHAAKLPAGAASNIAYCA